MEAVRSLLTDWKYFNRLSLLFLLGEAAFGAAIILRVGYTEIDWIAYMQEVEGWVLPGGSRDYKLLAGTLLSNPS
jgi:alpha-1,3-mannosyltransferase